MLRAQVTDALRRLRLERLELVQLHRIDPAVPLADQLGTPAELQAAGTVGRIGLSEVTPDELERARAVVDVASVQNRYSVADRGHEPVLAACEAAGIAFLPWRPVAGAAGDEVAELGATAAQVALAWLLAHSPVLLPVPGTSRIVHLEENVAAADLQLSAEQLDRLDRSAG